MQKFTVHKGLVAPMDRENVDTDAIIPKQFLKSIRKTGFGPNLFDEWRYLDHGEPGQDPASRQPNPDFVLNQPRYQGASILLARKNFGCGSSREQAPRALLGAGVAVVVARSFARIFYRNAINVGLALIEADVSCQRGDTVEVDLAAGTVRVEDKLYQGTRLPDFLMEILEDGGLVAHRRRQKGLA